MLIYLVLAAQFESFRDPLIILAGSVPPAISGALVFSFLGFTTLNIYSQVGLITLVGLVAKNGILIVQFANHLQETGMDKLHQIIEASGTRLRPILMTTAATVVGPFPLVLATGPGAGARNSIGIMLVSGMIIGSIFTLFVVPSLHMLLARRHVAVPAGEAVRQGSAVPIGATAVALALLLFAPPAQAQSLVPPAQTDTRPALQLTVDAAVRRAIENNPDLAVVRLATQAEGARVSEALGAYAPVFSTALGHSSNVVPPSNFLLGDRGVDTNDTFSSTGVRQRLRRGAGTWNVSWDTARTTTSSPITSFQPSLQSGFQLAFSQPLLKDRKMDPVRQQNIIAARNQSSAELRYNESVVQTTAAVKQAYWTLKATLANVGVQQRSLELADQLVRENRARVDVGLAPPLDLVQAQAETARRRENLILATTAAGDAEDRLRRLIIDPADVSFWRVRLEPTDEAVAAEAPPDVDAIVAGALGKRYDLARARNEVENARTNAEFLDNQKLPDVRLETSYRGNGLGGTQFLRSGGFPGTIVGSRSTGYGDVLGQMFGRSYPTWSLGLTASYTLGRSSEEASFARADIERRQAARRVATLEMQAVETIRQAARQVRSNLERIDAARAGATLAEQRLETETRRFEAGLSTSFLVTQAQRDLLQAQVAVLQATFDYQSSVVSFEALQQAPALGAGDTVGQRNGGVALMPPSAPRGLFRVGGN